MHLLSPFIIRALIHFHFTLLGVHRYYLTEHLLCAKHQAFSKAAEGGAWIHSKHGGRKTHRAGVRNIPESVQRGCVCVEAGRDPASSSLSSWQSMQQPPVPRAGHIRLSWHHSPRLIRISGAFLCLSPASQKVACPSCRESGFSSPTSLLYDCLVKTA